MPNGYKLSKIYVGNQLVRGEVRNFPYEKNAYTQLYLPLVDDAKDYGGKGHETVNTNITFTTQGTTPCAAMVNGNIQVVDTTGLRGGNGYTWCLWYKYTSGGSTAMDLYSLGQDQIENGTLIRILMSGPKYQCGQNPNSYGFTGQTSISFSLNQNWHNIVMTYQPNTSYVYVDGSLLGSKTASTASTYNCTQALRIGSSYDGGYPFKGYLSNVIVENRLWSASDISTYYNNTKSYFGL